MSWINDNLSEDFTPTTVIAKLCSLSMNLVTEQVTCSNPVIGIVKTIHALTKARSITEEIDKEIAEVYERYNDYETECEVIS